MFLGLMWLGIWQLERRIWKHALVAQIETRIHAPPVAPPEPSEWRNITADTHAYRRISIYGTYLNDRETLVQAATVLGSGYWVLTPMRTDQGFLVLVNRGFVPPERRNAHDKVEGLTKVTGLLRITEPDGGFLRSNDPAKNRWYSRDVAAIAHAKGLSHVAPYFIDANAAADPQKDTPTGGLTVVAFPDNHLAYALTWFTMALMVLAGTGYFLRQAVRDRKAKTAKVN
ncbi:Surfeit locus 1 family protein [Sphingobium sp. SCG-1]|nr:SURF1 family protein [Sphingobium sp. SCG-1]AUW56775.1 Surfeit locus 1 family protein [Sphingobium sp. SCG-1]